MRRRHQWSGAASNTSDAEEGHHHHHHHHHRDDEDSMISSLLNTTPIPTAAAAADVDDDDHLVAVGIHDDGGDGGTKGGHPSYPHRSPPTAPAAAAGAGTSSSFRFAEHFSNLQDTTMRGVTPRPNQQQPQQQQPPLRQASDLSSADGAAPLHRSNTAPGSTLRGGGGDHHHQHAAVEGTPDRRSSADVMLNAAALSPVVEVPFRTGEDVYQLPDLRMSSNRLDHLAQAAMDVKHIHQDLAKSVQSVTIAVRKQHLDTSALTQQQQRLAVRVETVWKIAAEVREESSTTTAAFRRHVQSSNDVIELLMRRTTEQQRQIDNLQRLLQRNALLTQREATREIQRKNEASAMADGYAKWVRFTLRRKFCRRIFNRTRRGVFSRFFLQWLRWSQTRSSRHVAHTLLMQTAQTARRRVLSRWIQFVDYRHSVSRKMRRLNFGTDRHLQHVTFRTWMAFLKHKKQLARRVRTSDTLASLTQRGLCRRFFFHWTQSVVLRRKRIRSTKLCYHLSSLASGQTRKRFFSLWLLAHQTQFKRRHQLVTMHDASLIKTIRLYWKKWADYRWQQWVLRQIEKQVAPVEYKVEIGLRTSTNTSDTIQQLLRHYAAVEDRINALAQQKVAHHELRLQAYRNEAEEGGGGKVAVAGSANKIQPIVAPTRDLPAAAAAAQPVPPPPLPTATATPISPAVATGSSKAPSPPRPTELAAPARPLHYQMRSASAATRSSSVANNDDGSPEYNFVPGVGEQGASPATSTTGPLAPPLRAATAATAAAGGFNYVSIRDRLRMAAEEDQK